MTLARDHPWQIPVFFPTAISVSAATRQRGSKFVSAKNSTENSYRDSNDLVV